MTIGPALANVSANSFERPIGRIPSRPRQIKPWDEEPLRSASQGRESGKEGIGPRRRGDLNGKPSNRQGRLGSG